MNSKYNRVNERHSLNKNMKPSCR